MPWNRGRVNYINISPMSIQKFLPQTQKQSSNMTTDHDPDNDHIKLLQIKTWETFTQYNIRAWILDTYAKNGGKPFSRVKMLEVYDSQADKLHPHWAPPEAGKPVATDAFKQYKLRRVKDRVCFLLIPSIRLSHSSFIISSFPIQVQKANHFTDP